MLLCGSSGRFASHCVKEFEYSTPPSISRLVYSTTQRRGKSRNESIEKNVSLLFLLCCASRANCIHQRLHACHRIWQIARRTTLQIKSNTQILHNLFLTIHHHALAQSYLPALPRCSSVLVVIRKRLIEEIKNHSRVAFESAGDTLPKRR